jgi:hypothetical protein
MNTLARISLALVGGTLLAAALAACSSTGSSAGFVSNREDPDASVVPSSDPASFATEGTVDAGEIRVTTVARLEVIDDGNGPAQLCGWQGNESLPPRCNGVDLIGWEWSEADGPSDVVQGMRAGDFFVTGTYSFDADELTVESATVDGPDIGFVWDGADGATCPDGHGRDPDASRPVYDEIVTPFVSEELGVQSYWSGDDGCGALAVGVAYDDGRMQSAVDEEFGEGAVVIVSLLRPIE